LQSIFSYGSEELFRYQLIKGQIAKELVKGLLETSDNYHVYSFGYESSISQLRFDVKKNKGRGVEHTPSNDRMRSRPDLIVYDKQEHKTSFVEVKFRHAKSPEHVSLKTRELKLAREYWGDSIWTIVAPVGHNFYAQKIGNIRILEEFKTHKYDLTKEFKPIEAEFSKVTFDNIAKYCKIREQFLGSNDSSEEEE